MYSDNCQIVKLSWTFDLIQSKQKSRDSGEKVAEIDKRQVTNLLETRVSNEPWGRRLQLQDETSRNSWHRGNFQINFS